MHTEANFFKLRKIKELIQMDNQEYKPVTNCLALTIRKEHRLIVIKNATKTTIRMSWKTLLYVLFLTIANAIV